MGGLNPCGLRFGKMKFILKVLVHHVDHSVTEPPEEEQGTDQGERKKEVLTVSRDEKTAFSRTGSAICGSESIH